MIAPSLILTPGKVSFARSFVRLGREAPTRTTKAKKKKGKEKRALYKQGKLYLMVKWFWRLRWRLLVSGFFQNVSA
jgi:hypothetical protein